MIKATTVRFELACLRRWFSPKDESENHNELTSQRFDKHIHALVAVFITPRCEKVDCIIQVEIVVTVKMA